MYLQGKGKSKKSKTKNLKKVKKVLDKTKTLWYNKYIIKEREK